MKKPFIFIIAMCITAMLACYTIYAFRSYMIAVMLGLFVCSSIIIYWYVRATEVPEDAEI